MSFIYNNLAVLYVAGVVSALGWLFGGTRSDVLSYVAPWMILMLAQVLFLFPQKRASETTYEARERVWHALKKDPVFLTSLGLVFMLAIPFANNGLCVGCDSQLIAQGISPEPPVKFLPFCVNRLDHYNVFLWFAVSLSCLAVTRHALVAHGKRMLLELIVWNGFALALVGFLQIATDAEGPLWQKIFFPFGKSTFFSTFGYPNMAGDYFTFLFGLAVAVWRSHNLEIDARQKTSQAPSARNLHRQIWDRHLMLVPAGVLYFAAISTLSRAAIILVNVILVIAFIHTLLDITHRMPRKDKVKKGTIAVAAVGLVAFFAVSSMPKDVQREINTLDTDVVLNRVTGKGDYHPRVAAQIWRDHKLFGCGGWGYKHFCVSAMTPAERKGLQQYGGTNVHNDYLQFLTEHGLVGFGAVVALVVLLLIPVCRTWKKLIKTALFTEKKRAPAKPVQIFALPAPVFICLLSLLATLIHAFSDCPLRSPAVLSLFFVTLATLPGFLPKEQDHAAR